MKNAFKKFLERKELEKPLSTKVTKREISVEERSKEVRNILTGLNIPDMTEEDIDYIIISLDIEKNGQLVYKGFVSLLE